MIRRLLSLPLVGLLFLNGCVTGSSTQGLSKSMLSTEKENELGAEAAKQVAEEVGLVDDPALLGYVQAVGARVAKQSPRQDVAYTFHIANMAEPNAFALPGGYIYVSRGLLALINSEDELAGVLGHEAGHVAAKHAAQSLTRAAVMAPVRIATAIGGSLAGIVAPRIGDFIVGVGETTTSLVLAPHSKTQEREADKLGQEMEAKAGYDPAALPRLLASLGREEKLHQEKGSGRSSFLSTHPATSDRVEQTAKRAKTLPYTPVTASAANRAELFSKLENLLIGPDPRDGVFVKSQYYHPGFELAVRFPDGWKTANEKTRVVAQSEKGEAILLLQVVGKGTDLHTVTKARLKKLGGIQEGGELRRAVNGIPALETQAMLYTSAGKMRGVFLWADHHGQIYELAGAAPPKRFDNYARELAASISSFRPFDAPDASAIQEWRLKSVRAGGTLSLRQLLEQNPSSGWNLEEAAVFNALETDSSVSPNQPVKLAFPQPFRSR